MRVKVKVNNGGNTISQQSLAKVEMLCHSNVFDSLYPHFMEVPRRFEKLYVGEMKVEKEIIHNGDLPFLIIPHSNFYVTNPPDGVVSITCVSTSGMVDFFLISTEGNQQSSMYWVMVLRTNLLVFTHSGFVCGDSSIEDSNVKILNIIDGLTILSETNSNSIAVMLNDGNFDGVGGV